MQSIQRYSTGIGIRHTFILPRVPVLQDSQSVNRQSLLELLSHVNTYRKQHLQKMKKQLSMLSLRDKWAYRQVKWQRRSIAVNRFMNWGENTKTRGEKDEDDREKQSCWKRLNHECKLNWMFWRVPAFITWIYYPDLKGD